MKEPRVILFALECHGLSNAKLNDDTLLVLFDDAKPLAIKEVFEHQNKELIISSNNGNYATAGLAVAAKHSQAFNWIGYIGGKKASIDPRLWIPRPQLKMFDQYPLRVAVDAAYAFYSYCYPHAHFSDTNPRQ